VLIRELPGSRVYLGAVCDEQARLQEWVEVWVQNLDLRDVAFSGSRERLANYAFDQRWRAEHQMYLANLPHAVIVTGMEQNNPRPLLIKGPTDQADSRFAPIEPTAWRICKDDALLNSFGLAPYSTSPFRYLYDPDAAGPKTFIATAADAPANSHVQGLERLKELPQVSALFNPQAGLIRVTRFCPLSLDDYLQTLEGRPWSGAGPEATRLFHRGVYADLQGWSASPKGMPFLLYGGRTTTDRPAAQAWSQIHKDLWLEAVAFLLRLFPGTGSHCYCKGFGDVSPLALEMVFDRPVQELETLVLCLRSVLVPSLAANEEIASLLLEQLETA
jgi:hypothetical protein